MLYFVCPRFACRTTEIPKILSFLHRATETSNLTWLNSFMHRSIRSAFPSQIDQNAPHLPWVDRKSNEVKVHLKHYFPCFYIKPKPLGYFSQLWPSLIEFDPTLTLKGPNNPNFDSAIRMGCDELHCEDYQIPFPTTIHGSKLELKRLRYPKNRAKRISTLPETITFDLTVWFPIF